MHNGIDGSEWFGKSGCGDDFSFSLYEMDWIYPRYHAREGVDHRGVFMEGGGRRPELFGQIHPPPLKNLKILRKKG